MDKGLQEIRGVAVGVVGGMAHAYCDVQLNFWYNQRTDRQEGKMTELILYTEAKLAVTRLHQVDEVKKHMDKAAAIKEYAARANDRELEEKAAKYRLWCQRRAGELIKEGQEKGTIATKGAQEGNKNSSKKQMSSGEDICFKPKTIPELGITRNQSSQWKKLAELPEQEFEQVVEEVAKPREVKPIADKARRRATTRKRETDLQKAKEEISEQAKRNLDDVCKMRACSCAELFNSGIKPDVVITDPPYPREFLHTFTELAEGCNKANVRVVAVMSGQSYLPDVMARLCEHLKYRWTLAYLTPGGQAVQQWQAKCNSSWKPVLLFGESIEWFGDVASSKTNDNDKRFHEWGQSESGMADLIERLSKPGDLICDPFIGGGTTAVVSLALGRRFIGCDIDGKTVEKAKARILG